MRAMLCGLLVAVAGCGKTSPTTTAEPVPVVPPVATKGPVPPAEVLPDKTREPEKPPVTEPKKNLYDVATAGDIHLTQPANLWGLPDQNRAVLKERFFGKRWNLSPDGNISVETDCVLSETHPHTEWLTVKLVFREPKSLLTFDRYKSKVNAYCVDAFTFVDAFYTK